MSSALQKALTHSRGISNMVYENTLREKSSGVMGGIMESASYGGAFGQYQSTAKYRERYSLFRGTLYSAINALAQEAAGQEFKVGKVEGKDSKDKKTPKDTKTLSMIKDGKRFALSKAPDFARLKVAEDRFEIVENHALVSALSQPNPVQGTWQFVYSFVANLCLTGWSYIVGGDNEHGDLEYWSLPTTWIKPIGGDGDGGYFSKFEICNPHKPSAGKTVLPRENVAFAHLPNPSDPLSALAPAAAQMMAIRIEDHIWASREQLFGNGIFPSVIVSIGRDPHPDFPSGIRPRLSGAHRRQIYGAVRKVMAGISNYGNPAIVDGLIEKIERLNMSATEMGWEKSEPAVQRAILGAFGVHPSILSQEVSVGGYAQAAIIEGRFYKKVNTYLKMLSQLMTNFAGNHTQDEGVVVWWEQCVAEDPSRIDAMMRFARQNNDISQNEFRAKIGFGPDEDRNESVLDKTMLNGVVQLLLQAAQGMVQSEQIRAVLEGLGLPTDMADKIAGKAQKDRQALEGATQGLQQAAGALQEQEEAPTKVGEEMKEEAEKVAREILMSLSR